MGTHLSNDAIKSHKTKQMDTKTKNANGVSKHDAKATDHSKSVKTDKKDKKLTDANIAAAAKKASNEKESKYNYPKDVKDAAQKKTFRRNARAQRNRFITTLEKLRASNEKADKAELKKVEEEQKEWLKKTYHIIPE